MKLVVCENCGSIYQLSDDNDIRKFRCAECHGSLRYFDNEVNEHNNSHEIEESYNYNVNNKRNNSHFNSSIKSKSKIKILDILIIICIICASCFAIYHVTSDEYVGTSVNFDSSTTNRLVENYLNFYDSGQIIKSQVNGINSTNGEKVSINGTVLWAGDSKGYNVKVIINSEGHNYLVGLQKDVPEADIYINQISLETTNEKYENVKDITISPIQVTSLEDLVSSIGNNTNYEISTDIAIPVIDRVACQELDNELTVLKQPRITLTNSPYEVLRITRADSQTLNLANSILGDINGQTKQITIRIYNCNDNDIKRIRENYNVLNIKDIT